VVIDVSWTVRTFPSLRGVILVSAIISAAVNCTGFFGGSVT